MVQIQKLTVEVFEFVPLLEEKEKLCGNPRRGG
jgi:hypothetical protein